MGWLTRVFDRQYIGKRRCYRYRGRSTKFGLDVEGLEASEWAVIVVFGA